MFLSFDTQTYQVCMEIEVDGLVHQSWMELPDFVIQEQFLALVVQASTTQRPARVKLWRTEPFYSKFDHCTYDREYSIEYCNEAYLNNY